MTRTPLADRILPNYSRSNELANMISHIIGAAMGAVILAVLIAMFVIKREGWAFGAVP